ncbi:MAG: 4Fe-4S binding protein [Proteobacteria bacterium]|nr:4Fe-4S binding protein [Pseudomonadota bacterium]
MADEVYYRLAKVLDSLPQGFPATDSGLEIRLLKKIFTEDEADLFCDLRLTLETAEEISKRTGRPLEGLDDRLVSMWHRGEVWGQAVDGVRRFRMMPWIVGIYEFQIDRMDREFCEMTEEYSMHFGAAAVGFGPSIMQVVPVERHVPTGQQALPYDQVSTLIENGQAWCINDCICKKEKGLMDNPCEKPIAVCLAIGDQAGVFDESPWGRAITKEEAFQVLERAEEAGLVHLTGNVETGHNFICNCCGCCCGVLGAIKNFGLTDITNSRHYAEIDPDLCTACGTCADERCQVAAIEEAGEVYRVLTEKCIGCGLCVTTCPAEAIALIRKPEDRIVIPPRDEVAWNDERARQRGLDYSAYK